MSWFNFFNNKTEDSSENKSEEYDEMEVKEKLGVLVHIGDGNYVLLLAPY